MKKRDKLKELWLNRPWIYIPEVVKSMRWYPYNRKTEYFGIWLRNCFYLNWQVAWRN